MQLKEWLSTKQGKIFMALAVAGSLLIAGLMFFPKGEKERGPEYEPDLEVPGNYVMLMDEPADNGSIMFSTMLSSLAVDDKGNYHPLFFLTPEGELDDHQMDSIDKMGLGSYDYILFTKDPENPPSVTNQINVDLILDMGPETVARFKGFEGILTVEDHEEALWASTIAKKTNKALVKGERTYNTQEEAWAELHSMGVPFEYVMVVNPMDVTTGKLHSSPGYDQFDDQFHIPGLSAVAGEVAAYRDAYVLTQ
ncbi:MAG: hypothetical protein U9R75_08320, partial [Candidatus Thermoplasmatota archaeon]|nr:hypothetical protein [Candidatus Thermoplasmatota archaeon]